MTFRVLWLFLAVSLVGLQCVIMVFSNHTQIFDFAFSHTVLSYSLVIRGSENMVFCAINVLIWSCLVMKITANSNDESEYMIQLEGDSAVNHAMVEYLSNLVLANNAELKQFKEDVNERLKKYELLEHKYQDLEQRNMELESRVNQLPYANDISTKPAYHLSADKVKRKLNYFCWMLKTFQYTK